MRSSFGKVRRCRSCVTTSVARNAGRNLLDLAQRVLRAEAAPPTLSPAGKAMFCSISAELHFPTRFAFSNVAR